MTQHTAYFQPQVGIGNAFEDAGPPIPFDVSEKLRSMGEATARQLRDNSENTDDLAPSALVEEHREKYGDEAAYYVYGVEDAVAEMYPVA